ncbi:UNVERIFIED_CONTAM: hypothetical protein K2H54_055277 [Gekko kuhli]
MGKSYKNKEGKSKIQKSKVSTYFTRETAAALLSSPTIGEDNMAAERASPNPSSQEEDDMVPFNRKDWKELKADLMKSLSSLVSELIQPMQKKKNVHLLILKAVVSRRFFYYPFEILYNFVHSPDQYSRIHRAHAS